MRFGEKTQTEESYTANCKAYVNCPNFNFTISTIKLLMSTVGLLLRLKIYWRGMGRE